jgi:AAA domain-containing protein
MKKGSELFRHPEEVELFTPVAGHEMYGLPDIAMLIEEFLPEGMSTGLTSKPGTGKTWLAFEVMRAIATGTEFLGKFKTRQGHVLFVGNDASKLDYSRQWSKLTGQHWRESGPGDERNEAPAEPHPFMTNVRFLIGEPILLEDQDDALRIIATNNAHLAEEARWVPTSTGEMVEDEEAQFGFDLIIIDTLSKVTNTPENDNTERDKVFSSIRFIMEATGAAVLLLHHNPGKDGDGGWRGASSQVGSLDNHFQLGRRDGKLMLVAKKFRGVRPEPVAFTIQNIDVKNIVRDDGTVEMADVTLVADGIEKAPATEGTEAPSINGDGVLALADAAFNDCQDHGRDDVVAAIATHPEFNGVTLERMRRRASDLIAVLVTDNRIKQTRKPSRSGPALYARRKASKEAA